MDSNQNRSSSGLVEIISYTEEFHREDLLRFLHEHRLHERGLQYHTVAVLGCQSSGKSTLLNCLFGTNFPTMDASIGRYQVTRGIWLGVDARSGEILVLDLEGTDSRERGEGAASFERKAALFALALAQVLIINVWAQDIGRYNAANLALLRTVFEQDVALFHREAHRTRLLFVLRDHVNTPLALLEKTLLEDLERIWDSINKPSSVEGASLSTFFDVECTSLPHKELASGAFEQAAADLRDRFYKGASGIFHESYHRGIAADGFAVFCQQIWQVVRENRELDIPTEKEALARIRCEEIAQEAASTFDADAADLSAAYERVMMHYQERSARYVPVVAAAKRKQLHDVLSLRAREAYRRRLQRHLETLAERFDHFVNDQLAVKTAAPERSAWKGFMDRLQRQRSELETAWKDVAVIPQCFVEDECWSELLAELSQIYRDRLDAISEAAEHRLATLLLEEAAVLFSHRLQEPLWEVLDRASAEQEPEVFWNRVEQEVVERVRDESAQHLHRALISTGITAPEQEHHQQPGGQTQSACGDDALASNLLKLHRAQTMECVWRFLRNQAHSPSALQLHLMKRFEDAFRFESSAHRIPRVWQASDDLRKIWLDALQHAMFLVVLLQHVHLNGNESCLLGEAEVKLLRQGLEERAAMAYSEAVRAQQAARVHRQVPAWMLVLLVLLGWNEFVAVLQRPFLLLSVLIVLGVVVTLGRLGLLVPARRLARVATGRLLAATIHSLREMGAPGDWGVLQVPPASHASAASPNRAPKHHPE
ncbi:hypothetical protein, conserved [Cyanidioschyzon merolae strain 10D]|uniref:Protein SEY1 homolog n=1 Tax=Cyanidioschyzon merolae (strain NIES-3377 / 10D) TaxID=280699 RepID=M1V5T9_CYAM1|nr:hypothetical protein, conserved [Cyanidioschyzon merolae strain 10D]BAM81250.1 hypothetical protein, conserved [Cyanidioschyzon merolae strain 10D]|eukprot:XP_005537286.1 hypothetical protein, conserved [Cyanidioschyzon merolae strain 10D]